MGTIGKQLSPTDYEFISMNKIDTGVPLEYIGPELLFLEDSSYKFIDAITGTERAWICHGHPCILRTEKPLKQGYIVRAKI